MEVFRANRQYVCRGCGKRIGKGELVFYTHSISDNICTSSIKSSSSDYFTGRMVLCWECVEKIADLWREHDPFLRTIREQMDGDEIIGHR